MKIALLPLALLALLPTSLPAQALNWAKGTPVSVTMTNRGFVPRRITLRSGRQYVLTLRNGSTRSHTFKAEDFFGQARVSPRDAGWIRRNEVELRPGERATLHIVAPTTPRAMYYFKSTRIEDAASDYKGDIIVR